jgi:HEAT repeat protein
MFQCATIAFALVVLGPTSASSSWVMGPELGIPWNCGPSLQKQNLPRVMGGQGKKRGLVLPGKPKVPKPGAKAGKGKPKKAESGVKRKSSGRSLQGLEAFEAALARKRDRAGIEELVARYGLLSEDDREKVRLQAYSMAADKLKRIAGVWGAFRDRRAAPVLQAVLHGRKLGARTEPIVKALLSLSGNEKRSVAFLLLASTKKPVRLAAEHWLSSRPAKEDLARIEDLLLDGKKGARISAVRILSVWVRDRASFGVGPVVRLLEHRDPGVRILGARTLQKLGDRASGELVTFVTKGGRNEGVALALLILSRQELLQDRDLVPPEVMKKWAPARLGGKPLDRNLAQVLAATRAYRDPNRFRSAGFFPGLKVKELVSELIDSVKVDSFFQGLSLCHDEVLLRLRLLSGVDFGVDGLRWKSWWREVRADFLPYRRVLPLDRDLPVKTVLVQGGRKNGRPLAFVGPEATETKLQKGTRVFRLSGVSMQDLFGRLQKRGLWNLQARLEDLGDLPEEVFIWASNPLGRARESFPGKRSLRWKSFSSVLEETAAREVWQTFLPPLGDAAGQKARWESFSVKRDRLKDPKERRSFDVALIAKNYTTLLPEARLAARELLRREGRRAEGIFNKGLAQSLLKGLKASINRLAPEEVVEILEPVARLGDQGLLEQSLSLVDEVTEGRLGAKLGTLLAAAGPKQILVALKHRSFSVRAAAAAEAGRIGLPAVRDILVSLLHDPEAEVRMNAAESCGRLRISKSFKPLVALLKDSEALVRRQALFAIGSLSNKNCYDVLWDQTAKGKTARERLWAVQALGNLRDERVVNGLLLIAASQYPRALGLQALEGLRGRGGARVRASVRRRLAGTRSASFRRELVLLLGEMHDPMAFTEIHRMLAAGLLPSRTCAILARISGKDFCQDSDRVKKYQAWWEKHGSEGAARWFLDALAERKVDANLRETQFVPGASKETIHELCRVLTKSQDEILASMSLFWLRELTGKDFGPFKGRLDAGKLQSIAELYKGLAEGGESTGR